MSTYHTFGATTYTLGNSISSTDNTILLSSFLEPVTGTPYTMALLNTDIAYGTIAPKTTSSEFISFIGITQNANGTATLTGVTRGLAKKYPFTSSSAYKLPHAGQSQFIISDAPQVFEKYAALENDENITGTWDFMAVPNTQSDPVSGDDLARRSWVLSVVNGGAVSQNSVIVVGRAGETLVSGNLIYLKTADGLWWKTDADTVATVDGVILGIAQGAGTAGNAITGGVLLNGIDPINTGLTAGATYYASNTAGAISSSVGTTTKAIGKANSIGALIFDANFTTLPTQKEKDAMAGGGDFGIPSSTNKFITQAFTVAKIPTKQLFASSGTYTKPAGLVYAVVETIGGGGGGGGVDSSSSSGAGAGGGGGGGYSRRTLAATSIGATETVTVGTGGAGGLGVTPATGGTGVTSTFGSLVSASGGTGGLAGNGTTQGAGGAGGGGTTATPDINSHGSGGGAGVASITDTRATSGNGGSSFFGGGAPGVTNSSTGSAGTTYGGGGSGASATNNDTRDGGAGADGVILVTEFYS